MPLHFKKINSKHNHFIGGGSMKQSFRELFYMSVEIVKLIILLFK